ncbi:MAG: AraC-like DNA-binding protein [Crocinitomix sp.]|jgi:AraC-like DNA-binding protein
MSLYNEIIPNGDLSKYIESYWESPKVGSLVLAPEGTFHILYSPQPFTLCAGQQYSLGPGLYILPINYGLNKIIHQSPILMIRAKAFTLSRFQYEAHLFALKNTDYWQFDQNIPLFRYLTSIYLKSCTAQSQSQLEELIYDLVTDRIGLNRVLREKVNYILERKGMIRINDMTKHFGISRQYLHKYFNKHLNISPKQLSNIWRINHFLDLANNENSLTSSAIDSGYFDQAHCIKEFKQFFTQTPKKFLSHDFDFTLNCINNRFNHCYDPQ